MNEYHWGTTTSFDHYDNILCIGSLSPTLSSSLNRRSTDETDEDHYFISPKITIYHPDAILKLDSTQSIPFDSTHQHCKTYIELANELNKPLYYIQGHYKHQQFFLDNFLQIDKNQTKDITFSYYVVSYKRM